MLVGRQNKAVRVYNFCLSLQFALEKEQGLPSISMMDPSSTTKEASQTGFIRFILIPLFESLKKVKLNTFRFGGC